MEARLVVIADGGQAGAFRIDDGLAVRHAYSETKYRKIQVFGHDRSSLW